VVGKRYKHMVVGQVEVVKRVVVEVVDAGGQGGQVEWVVSMWCVCGGQGHRGGQVVMVGRWSVRGGCAG
jgi:hypothetical protein